MRLNREKQYKNNKDIKMNTLKIKRHKHNHFHFFATIENGTYNIFLDSNLTLGRTIFKDCYWIIKNLEIDIDDLERKLIQSQMFGQKKLEIDYKY